MIKINIPGPVGYILRKLNDAGFEAFAVGGCVRDALIGRPANDWDITTSALPADVKKVFKRTIDTGIKHGTVTVLLHEGTFEVTTYRIDGVYEDSRHPREVTFTSEIKEDLRRRDFTINAMAYHPEVGLVDPYDGLGDLKRRLIKAVGEPDERFNEDALRIMRAVRFAAQLGFAIEPATFAAIERFAPRLELVSHERIRVELVKLLSSDHPEMFRLLYDTGITKVIFPVFDVLMETEQNCASHNLSVGEHTLKVIEYAPKEELLRVTAMLHDIGKPEKKSTGEDGRDTFRSHHVAGSKLAADWLREYKFDNDTIDKVSKLILYHDFLLPKTEAGVRKMLSEIGPELYAELMKFMRADNMAKSESTRDKRLPMIDELSRMYEDIMARGDCFDLKHLAVRGADLIAAGVKPGREMGELLSDMLEAVIEDPGKNTKDELMKMLKT